MFDVGLVDDALELVREILEDHDAAGTAVFELVLKFARRIQRIDVDGDQPRAKQAAHRDGVLQDIRQHDRDAFAARHAEGLLQVTGEMHGQFVELPVAQRGAHIRVGGPFRPGVERLFEQLAERTERRGRQARRDAFRIGFQPDFVHIYLAQVIQCSTDDRPCIIQKSRLRRSIRVYAVGLHQLRMFRDALHEEFDPAYLATSRNAFSNSSR